MGLSLHQLEHWIVTLYSRSHVGRQRFRDYRSNAAAPLLTRISWSGHRGIEMLSSKGLPCRQ